MDAREQLLQAALKVYSTSGVRGATTKRIAQAAGVNEVTLFRHFGSKDALLQEALAQKARALFDAGLPSLKSHGLVSGDWVPDSAASMLLGTLFYDVRGRDCMPQCDRIPSDE